MTDRNGKTVVRGGFGMMYERIQATTCTMPAQTFRSADVNALPGAFGILMVACFGGNQGNSTDYSG